MKAAALLIPALAAAQVAHVEVSETAGLRRFDYPVRGLLRTGIGPEKLILTSAGKPVPAQFTSVAPGVLALDFNVGLAPGERRSLLVAEGAPLPVPSPMSVEETAAGYVVRHPGDRTYRVPKDLRGLLGCDYTAPGTPGLAAFVPERSRIVKSGPLACSLRFEGAGEVVEMEFPRSKSWVEVRWTVPETRDLAVDLKLRLEGQPRLVDFGAGTMIYAVLRRSARMWSHAGSWGIDLNGEPYASGRDRPAEGWAHIMDARRATAIAVADFPGSSLEVSADGRLQIRARRKVLAFWLHFVTMPVQVGAATAPQSMLHPPVVTCAPLR